MAWIPSKNWGFVSLGNSSTALWLHEILLHHFIDNMQGVKPEDRFDFDKKYSFTSPSKLPRVLNSRR